MVSSNLSRLNFLAKRPLERAMGWQVEGEESVVESREAIYM